MTPYPRWKYAVFAILVVFGFLYALPNWFGDDPAVQIAGIISEEQSTNLLSILSEKKLSPQSVRKEEGGWVIRFARTQDQLKAKDLLEPHLPPGCTAALYLAPATPKWLQAIGAHPMKLGLDLRGGVHFLLDVDLEAALTQRLNFTQNELKSALKEHKLHYDSLSMGQNHTIIIGFPNTDAQSKTFDLVKNQFRDYEWRVLNEKQLEGTMVPRVVQEIQSYTLEQTMNTLRNRVNELGVAEAVVHRQGVSHLVVELPGIQEPARAKDLLGKTATLSFHMREEVQDLSASLQGRSPPGSRLYHTKDGQAVLLKKHVILSGDAITSASATLDSQDGRPVVQVHLGGNIQNFKRVTRENVGKQMAVVYTESQSTSSEENGQTVFKTTLHESIISLATIQSALGNQFQISGLGIQEAKDLALLLRAGALPVRVSIIEERTIGPSLGQDNIDKGLYSVALGSGLVIVFMACYYSIFGWLANIALIFNVLLLTALLSLFGATLTLPGIAGIVLTVGMAVDANVLIFERIREEIRLGCTPKASIQSGFERALSTIVDANLTTLIVGLLLFGVGSGPIRGFAVTLCLGILTSMITAVSITRAMVEAAYGHRKIKHLPIGI